MCVAVMGCRTVSEQVPMTERTRPKLLTSEAKEIEMGQQAYAQILSEETLSTNAEAAAMVQRVGERIAAVSGRPDFAWEFKLVAGPTMNAFCLPGGKVAIYEGILPVCQSEAGLAVVMSHEVAHALARHGGERMNHEMLKNGVATAARLGLNRTGVGVDDKTVALMGQAYGVASKYGVILPYSRKHESEADVIGLKLMAEAGYDPSEAPHFWDRFSSQSGSKPPEFFSTHPSDARRAADLRTQLPEALVRYKAAPQQYGLGDAVPVPMIASEPADNGIVPAAPDNGIVPAAHETTESGPQAALQPNVGAPILDTMPHVARLFRNVPADAVSGEHESL